MELLDVSRADTRIWLIKVPTEVAKVWRPLCEQSMSSTSIDEDDGAVELGTIRTVQSQDEKGPKADMMLYLKGPTNGLPSEYRMNQIPSLGSTATMAVSYKAPEQDGEDLSQMRVDGTVHRSFNLMPIQKVDEHGNMVIDEAYRSLTKKRTILSAVKPHPVKIYEDTRENRVATLANTKVIIDQKRRFEESRQKRQADKRLRKDRTELEVELFRLFERQPHWPFLQLQNETRQPAQYLKEVLGEMAVYVKRGPNKDMYELKNEYKEGGKSNT